jgi:xanthine dehydrogenase YagS FAD-binding subunit
MHPFSFARAADQSDALAQGARGGRFIAGGTTVVDLMREGVEAPDTLIDINALPLHQVASCQDRLEIGALARMSDVAAHPDVIREYPAISQSLLLSASQQLRNMASIGGNLLQRTRCTYFRDVTASCNKRAPGSGCSAYDGENRPHAILGGSPECVATHPSDLAVALVALGASVILAGQSGERSVALDDLYPLPGPTPHVENALRPGELIVRVDVPAGPHTARSGYLKVRDRQSYEFALVSVAVAIVVDGDIIRDVRIAAGGVGTRPWRFREVEQALIGRPALTESYAAAARIAVQGASPLAHNAFKVELLPRTLVRALETIGARA